MLYAFATILTLYRLFSVLSGHKNTIPVTVGSVLGLLSFTAIFISLFYFEPYASEDDDDADDDADDSEVCLFSVLPWARSGSCFALAFSMRANAPPRLRG